MSSAARETTEIHTRLLKCALEIEDSRAFWSRSAPGVEVNAEKAFDEYWFGARSLERVVVLLANMRARFSAFPSALRALHRWEGMSPDTRRLVCHFHLQLSDPLYRKFTGEYLVDRREKLNPEIDRDLVAHWVGEQGLGRWTMSTRIQFASKLLSASYSAGLVGKKRDPRTLTLPRVPNDALEYLLYLLREVEFEGSLLKNPYLASIGLEERDLETRLRTLPGLEFVRQGDLAEFGWRYPNLDAWSEALSSYGEHTANGAFL